jgi:esterase/lipase
LVLVVAFLLGPRADFDESWTEPDLGPDVVRYLNRAEADVPDIRPGDAKGIVWSAAGEGVRTPLALVYLHGFSADRHEVEPLVTDVAAALGANAYFARLRGHGRTNAAMADASVEGWMADAAEALAVGARIGERVVLMGTSTGGTLAVWAAGRPEAEGRLAALVLVSPNFQPRNRMTRLLLWPWGGVIARLVEGSERCFEAHGAEHARHWTTCYPTSALLPMMALVEHVRTSDLGAIETPLFVAYSAEDQIVDPAETEAAFRRFGSAPKRLVEVQSVGDPDGHVLAGDALSPATTERLEGEIVRFLAEAAAGG